MSTIFYTTANKEYEYFVPLYIYFVLRSNPEAYVEIGIEDADSYKSKNKRVLDILREKFGEQFNLKTVNFENILPGAVRFVTEPTDWEKFDYVYIGDIDILILEQNIEQKHIRNINENDAPFSNIIRGEQSDRLSGLHFAPTDLQYPLQVPENIDVTIENNALGADERGLYNIMKDKGVMISSDMDFRPTHGIHARTHNHPFGVRSDWRGPIFSFKEIINGNQIYEWTGIERSNYRNQFEQVLQEEQFQKLFFNIDIRAKNTILIIENICANRFDLFEDEMCQYVLSKYINTQLVKKKLSNTFIGDVYNKYKCLLEN